VIIIYRVRLSRGISIIIMITSGLACLLGIFIVIPQVPLIGILWVVFTAGFSVFHGINAFTNRGIANYHIDEKNKRNLK
jgi:hypothetical protein